MKEKIDEKITKFICETLCFSRICEFPERHVNREKCIKEKKTKLDYLYKSKYEALVWDCVHEAISQHMESSNDKSHLELIKQNIDEKFGGTK